MGTRVKLTMLLTLICVLSAWTWTYCGPSTQVNTECNPQTGCEGNLQCRESDYKGGGWWCVECKPAGETCSAHNDCCTNNCIWANGQYTVCNSEHRTFGLSAAQEEPLPDVQDAETDAETDVATPDVAE